MSEAEQLKAQGNAAFSAKEYNKAIDFYSQAIDIDPMNHTLYSNRSGSYCAAGRYPAAEADARKVISIKPDWVRGHTRLGAALEGQERWEDAAEAYKEALKYDPNNDQIKEDLKNVEEKMNFDSDDISAGINNLFSPQALSALAFNPKTAHLFADPAFKTMIEDIKASPKNFSKYQSDPRLMTVLQALLEPMMANMPKDEAKVNEEENNEEPPKPAPKAAPKPAPKVQEVTPEKTADAKAESEKNLGNEKFKAGDLDAALAHYNKAIELDPTNVTYYSNKATVLSKQKLYDEAVDCVNKGITMGRENKASYESIAKAYTKIASAEAARNNLDAAIEALNASLLEKNDVTVRRELKRLSDLNVKRKAKEYESPELSEIAKNEGNEFFRNGDFPKAIESYTEAIKRSPKNPALYSNRAAAYTKLGALPSAIADCDKAIEIEPTFIKAYTRKGYCHFVAKEYHKAQTAYQNALKIDANNADAVDGLQSVNAAINMQRFAPPDEEQIKRATSDPEIQKILSDPGMQQILQDMRENPRAAQAHLSNPAVVEALNKLQAAGLLR